LYLFQQFDPPTNNFPSLHVAFSWIIATNMENPVFGSFLFQQFSSNNTSLWMSLPGTALQDFPFLSRIYSFTVACYLKSFLIARLEALAFAHKTEFFVVFHTGEPDCLIDFTLESVV